MIIINPYRFATGSVYDSDFLTWESYLSTPLSAGNRIIFNQFFKDLKGTGNVGSFNNFAELDRLWILASENQQGARISLVNPSSTSITEINSPSWTQYRGYSGNATTSYLNLQFNPTTNNIKYQQNSASLIFYCRSGVSQLTMSMGSYDTSGSGKASCIFPNFGGSIYAYVNNAASSTALSIDERGLIVASRNNSTTESVYKNGTLVGSYSATSVSPPNLTMFGLCGNVNGAATYLDNRQYSIFGMGSGNLDQSSFNSAVSSLATSLGFNI